MRKKFGKIKLNRYMRRFKYVMVETSSNTMKGFFDIISMIEYYEKILKHGKAGNYIFFEDGEEIEL